jgi:hypothetical protein
MICGAFGLPVHEGPVAPFADLGPENRAGLEPRDYGDAATNAGIIFVYGDGTFRAPDILTPGPGRSAENRGQGTRRLPGRRDRRRRG